jgi:hypothetical protein
LEVINHSLSAWRGIQSVRPVSLIEGSKDESEFTVHEWTDNAVYCAFGVCTEPCVATDLVVAESDSHVVEVGCVGRPGFDVVDGEGEFLICVAGVRGNGLVAFLNCDLNGAGVS